jgi:hypothetical protein
MAREKKPVAAANDAQQQEEMTVVVFKFKGGAESMQKGFDAVNNAVAALGSPSHGHPRVIMSRTSAQLPPAPPTGSPNSDVIDAEHEDVVEQPETVGIDEETAAPNNGGKPKKANAPKYAFMNDLNLAPDNEPAWTDYAAEHNPQTVDDKFLVASAWLQTHGGCATFGGGHLFTCFRAMDWKTQVDMTQPLRKLKSVKSWYENPQFGEWKLTGIGLTAAEKVGKE